MAIIAITVIFAIICIELASAQTHDMLTEIVPGDVSGYDRRILPTKNGDPVEVLVKIYVQRLADSKKSHSHFGIEFVMHTLWNDHRLKFNESQLDDLRLVGKQTELIWTPDITFQQKLGSFSTVTTWNTFAVINSNGSILQSQRVMLMIFCPMDFTFFPFDEQVCTIPVMSYAYNDQQLMLDWHKTLKRTKKYGAGFDEHKKMGEFYIEDYYSSKKKHNNGFAGVHDTLTFTMHLHRKFSRHFVRIFLPLILIVLLSFVSFWIDYRSSPARTIIATTIFLTAMMFIVSLQKSFPPTTSVRSIDLYSLGCFLFVFGTIVEFALVQTVDIRVKIKNSKQKKNSAEDDGGLTTSKQTKSNQSSDSKPSRKVSTNRVSQDTALSKDKEGPNSRKKGLAQRRKRKESIFQRVVEKIYTEHEQHRNEYHVLDEISKKLFPIAFVIMNAVYFIVFTLLSQ